LARYRGPKCKLSRREGTDLYLKSARRALDTKCKQDSKPANIAEFLGQSHLIMENNLERNKKSKESTEHLKGNLEDIFLLHPR